MPIAALLPLITTILTGLPGAIAAVQDIWKLATQDAEPTAEEKAAYDAALDAAHKALQAS